jgi:hypothetical protein
MEPPAQGPQGSTSIIFQKKTANLYMLRHTMLPPSEIAPETSPSDITTSALGPDNAMPESTSPQQVEVTTPALGPDNAHEAQVTTPSALGPDSAEVNQPEGAEAGPSHQSQETNELKLQPELTMDDLHLASTDS